jgi:hypothetical protein
MEHNKEPRRDDFSTKLYQCFLEVLKKDLMAMFKQLQSGDLLLFKLFFGVIILLPKKEMPLESKNTDQFACSMLASNSLPSSALIGLGIAKIVV